MIIGPYSWHACLCQNGQSLSTYSNIVDHDLKENKSNLNIEFNNLINGKTYDACIGITSVNIKKIPCSEICSKKPTFWSFQCKSEKTECKHLPKPSGIPSQIPWSSENNNSFNPFTEIKVEMSAGTFDGQLSGLNRFNIRSVFSFNF